MLASSKGAAVGIGLKPGLRGFVARLRPQPAGADAMPWPGVSGLQPRAPTGLLQGLLKTVPASLAAEQERWFPWCVVAFGSGIAIYFALQTEPSIWLAIFIALAAAVAASRGPKGAGTAMRFLCMLIAAGGLGFAAAKLRTVLIDSPRIMRDVGPVKITGRIEQVEIKTAKRARILLAPQTIADGKIARVRLTLVGAKAVAAVTPGATVTALAMLRPPPEPALPHGYDFARWAYFQGIGGVGFSYGAPKPLEAAPQPGLVDRMLSRVEALRLSMRGRIEGAIPGRDGTIAAALITGERADIEDDDAQAYRDSGLAHVLSISGLHLALAGLGVFWVIRALLALWPRVALTQPIKKWAAVAAFFSASFYLAISGGGSPAVRSYLMLSMMLLGVLADRPALSMRGVALAALALLAFEPEDIVDPGFQMSFAAVIGLIALAEWGAARPRDDAAEIGRLARLWRRSRRYVVGMLLVSTVATLATTPFAIYHFDRAAFYSLLANFLAEPVVAFVIMPAAAIAVLTMPFGLETSPLYLMGWGVHAMTSIAHWVADLPGATTLVRAWPVEALVAVVFGGLWIALWRLNWRWLGLAPIAIALAAIAARTAPDVFIARDAQSAAVRTPDGTLVILGVHPDDYTAAQWLLRDGDRREVSAARAGAHCDEMGCVAQSKGGRLVASSLRPGALADDCSRANIVISAVPVRTRCGGRELVLDRFDIARSGATSLTLGARGIAVETVAADRGQRPWSVHAKN
jgi:competence protein ComEC